VRARDSLLVAVVVVERQAPADQVGDAAPLALRLPIERVELGARELQGYRHGRIAPLQRRAPRRATFGHGPIVRLSGLEIQYCRARVIPAQCVPVRWLWFWRPPCLLKRVLVNLTYNPSEALEGVLWSSRGGWLTLREVSALTVGQPPTKVDGDVVIHTDKVAYFQVLLP